MTAQTGETNWGLWSRDTNMGANGYFIEYGNAHANTRFHIFPTDGIRGRDVATNGSRKHPDAMTRAAPTRRGPLSFWKPRSHAKRQSTGYRVAFSGAR